MESAKLERDSASKLVLTCYILTKNIFESTAVKKGLFVLPIIKTFCQHKKVPFRRWDAFRKNSKYPFRRISI